MNQKKKEKKVSKQYEFKNKVEVFEEITYQVDAKNKPDATEAVKLLLSSQDTLQSIVPKKGTIYEAKVWKLTLREGPPEMYGGRKL